MTYAITCFMRKNVRIQKKLISMKGEDKRYVYTVTIPEKVMQSLKWKEGTELSPQVLTDDILIFKKAR